MEKPYNENADRISSELLIADLEAVCTPGDVHILPRWSSDELLQTCLDLFSRPIPSSNPLSGRDPIHESPSHINEFYRKLEASAASTKNACSVESFSHSCLECSGADLCRHNASDSDSLFGYSNRASPLAFSDSSSQSFNSCNSGVNTITNSTHSLIDFVSCSSLKSVSGNLASNPAGDDGTQTICFSSEATAKKSRRHSRKKRCLKECKNEHFLPHDLLRPTKDHCHSAACITKRIAEGQPLVSSYYKVCQFGPSLGLFAPWPVLTNARKCHSAIPLSGNTFPEKINTSGSQQAPCYAQERRDKEGNVCGTTAPLPSPVPNDSSSSVCSQQPYRGSCQISCLSRQALIQEHVITNALQERIKKCPVLSVVDDNLAVKSDLQLASFPLQVCDNDNDTACDSNLFDSIMAQGVPSNILSHVRQDASQVLEQYVSCGSSANSTRLEGNFSHPQQIQDGQSYCNTGSPTPPKLDKYLSDKPYCSLYHAVPAMVSSDLSESDESKGDGEGKETDMITSNRIAEVENNSLEALVPFIYNSPLIQDNNNEVNVCATDDHIHRTNLFTFISESAPQTAASPFYNLLSNEGKPNHSQQQQDSVISGSVAGSESSADKGVKEVRLSSSPLPDCAFCPTADIFGGIYFITSPSIWWFPLFIPPGENLEALNTLVNFTWCLATSGEYWQLILNYDGCPTVYQKEAMASSEYIQALKGENPNHQSITSKLCGFSISPGDNARVKTLLPVFDSKTLAASPRDVTKTALLRPKSSIVEGCYAPNFSPRHSASGDVLSYRKDSAIIIVPGGKHPGLTGGPPSPSSIKLCGITLGSLENHTESGLLHADISTGESFALPELARIFTGCPPTSPSEDESPSVGIKQFLNLSLASHSAPTPSLTSSPQSPSERTFIPECPSTRINSSYVVNENIEVTKLPDSVGIAPISKDIPVNLDDCSSSLQVCATTVSIKENLSSLSSTSIFPFPSPPSDHDNRISLNSSPSTVLLKITPNNDPYRGSCGVVDNAKYSNSINNNPNSQSYSHSNLNAPSVSSSPLLASYCPFNVSPIPFGSSTSTSRASSRSPCNEVDSGPLQPICFPPRFAHAFPSSTSAEIPSYNFGPPDVSSNPDNSFIGPFVPLSHPSHSQSLDEGSIDNQNTGKFPKPESIVSPITTELCLPTLDVLSVFPSTSVFNELGTCHSLDVPEVKHGSKDKLNDRPPMAPIIREIPPPSSNDAAFKGSHKRKCGSKFPLDVLCRGRVFELQKRTKPEQSSEETDHPNYPRRRLASFDHFQPFGNRPYPATRSKSTGRMELGVIPKLDMNISFGSKESCIQEELESSVDSLSVLSSTDLAGKLYNFDDGEKKFTESSFIQHSNSQHGSFTLDSTPIVPNPSSFPTHEKAEYRTNPLALEHTDAVPIDCLMSQPTIPNNITISDTKAHGSDQNKEINLPLLKVSENEYSNNDCQQVISGNDDVHITRGLPSLETHEIVSLVIAPIDRKTENTNFSSVNKGNFNNLLACELPIDVGDSDDDTCKNFPNKGIFSNEGIYQVNVPFAATLSSISHVSADSIQSEEITSLNKDHKQLTTYVPTNLPSQESSPATNYFENQKSVLLENFCEEIAQSVLKWSDLESLITECHKSPADTQEVSQSTESELGMSPFETEEQEENLLYESAISVVVDEVSDDEVQDSVEVTNHEDLGKFSHQVPGSEKIQGSQEIFVSVLEVQQFVPNFGGSGSASTLVGTCSSPCRTPLLTPTPPILAPSESTEPCDEVSSFTEELSLSIDDASSFKDDFIENPEKDTSKFSDTATTTTSWSAAYPSEDTENSGTSSISSSDGTIPRELQIADSPMSASASSTGSAYSWGSIQGPCAHREMLPLEEDQEQRCWNAAAAHALAQSDDDREGYESDDDFESMDAEMQRLEEKLKEFEKELGFSSSEKLSFGRKENSGPQVYIRPQDIEELRSFVLPSVYPPANKLRTKHLSLIKKEDQDFGLESDCDAKSSQKYSSSESGEMLFLKSKIRLQPGDRRCRSAFVAVKQNSKDKSSNIDLKEPNEPNTGHINEEAEATVVPCTDSQHSSEEIDSSGVFLNKNCLGYLWPEDDGMTALDFDELEDFHLGEIQNSVFFIFEDDEDPLEEEEIAVEEEELIDVAENIYENYNMSLCASNRTKEKDSASSLSGRSDKGVVSTFKNSFKKAAMYLGPKSNNKSKIEDSDVPLSLIDEDIPIITHQPNFSSVRKCEIIPFPGGSSDGSYSSGEYYAAPAICIAPSDEERHSSSSSGQIHPDINSLSQGQHSCTQIPCNCKILNQVPGGVSNSPQYGCWYDLLKNPSTSNPMHSDDPSYFQSDKERLNSSAEECLVPSHPPIPPPVPPRSFKQKHKFQLKDDPVKFKVDTIERKQFFNPPQEPYSSTNLTDPRLPYTNSQGDNLLAASSVRRPSSSQAGNHHIHLNLPNSDHKSSPTRRSWPPRM